MSGSARIPRLRLVETPQSAPQYELRIRRLTGEMAVEIWRMPSAATPYLHSPTRLAGLHGRALEMIEHRIFRQIQRAGLHISSLRGAAVQHGKPVLRTAIAYNIPEDLALNLGLLFRALAPMRNWRRLRQVTEGIEAMGKEETSYWLSMAIYRKNPRRVLTALRYILTDPDPAAGR